MVLVTFGFVYGNGTYNIVIHHVQERNLIGYANGQLILSERSVIKNMRKPDQNVITMQTCKAVFPTRLIAMLTNSLFRHLTINS